MRRASSCGCTFKARKRGVSSARRTAGMIPVASARTFLIHLTLPIPPLLLNIFLIVKTPYFEEGRLYEAHQVLDTAFLLGAIWPAQLHPYPHFQRGVSKHRIPFRDLAVAPPLQSDRLRSVKHTQQGATAPAGQMLGQGAHQTFYRLVLHQTDAHQAGVLQTRGEEVDALTGAIDELHFHFSKIVLTELSRESFKTNQRPGRLWPKRGDQGVKRGLTSLIAHL